MHNYTISFYLSIQGEKGTENYTFQFLKLADTLLDKTPERDESLTKDSVNSSENSRIPLVGILSNIIGTVVSVKCSVRLLESLTT